MTFVRQSDRGFGLMFGTVFLIVAGIGWLFFDALLGWAIIVAACFYALALIMPQLLLPLNRLWGRFTGVTGLIGNTILLGGFMYVMLWPTGALLRLFGADPMKRKLQRGSGSYLEPVVRKVDAPGFHDMF